MIYTDIWAAMLQNFIIIEVILFCVAYFQNKLTLSVFIKDMVLAFLLAIIYMVIDDFVLLLLVIIKGIEIFRKKGLNKQFFEAISILLNTCTMQITIFSISTYISQKVYFLIRNKSFGMTVTEANRIALMSITGGVLLDLVVFFMVILNKETLVKVKDTVSKFSLEKQTFWFSISLFMAIEVIITIGNIQGITATIQLAIITIFIIFIGMTLWQVILFLKAYSIRQEANDQFARNQQLQEYLVNIEQQYTELRRFKHDYQNILLSLESFAEKGDQQQFKAYYQELLAQRPIQNEIQGAVIAQLDYLKNDPIRGLVIQKFLAAKQASVALKFEITEPIELPTNNLLTVIRIIGILLDNAIEQAVQETDKLVSCAFLQSEGLIEITIENAASQVKTIQDFSKLGYSTKGAGRGTGLANVQDLIAKQTNLFLETQIENKKLRQTLMITEET